MNQTALSLDIGNIRLDGGRPCLDFVNTIHDRHAEVPVDYLATRSHYLQWCQRVHLLEPRQGEHMPVAAAELAEVRHFREQLYALFLSRIDDMPTPPSALRELDRWVHRAWSDLWIDLREPAAVSWSRAPVDAHLPLKRIALSALDLLRSGDSHRLKRCSAVDACGWLFYDESKAGRRRWCAMETCGTVEKMRRYRTG